MPDSWYPKAEDYYVPQQDAPDYPTRQGDVFGSGSEDAPTAAWAGFVVVSPSCEVQNKSAGVQVARLHHVAELHDDWQRTAITYGFDSREDVVRVAFAHTFWFPPAKDDGGSLLEPLFVNFREVVDVPTEDVTPQIRCRAMTHDARLYFIRRSIFHRYRWNLSIEQVRTLESERISGDANFKGPRPPWATDPTMTKTPT